MTDRPETTKVLITVMTYPHPSRGYQELVCTAGVTDSPEWVRLYPLDYRYRPTSQRFKKYQWIEVELSPRGSGNDNRKESRRPNLDTIRLLEESLTTKKNWKERRQIIDQLPHYTLIELKARYKADRTSLGIVRPNGSSTWRSDRRRSRTGSPSGGDYSISRPSSGHNRSRFANCPSPFTTSSSARTARSRTPPCARTGDSAPSFLKERERLGSDDAAALTSSPSSWTNCAARRRTLGSSWARTSRYNTWMVLGVFWPPKTDSGQKMLF